jgi:DNA transformation protein
MGNSPEKGRHILGNLPTHVPGNASPSRRLVSAKQCENGSLRAKVDVPAGSPHATDSSTRRRDGGAPGFPPLLCGFAPSRLCAKFFASVADESFKEFVLDQLGALPEVRARAMFGAHGLYCGERFFAILDEGQLFFKTNKTSQADYVARGMGPFSYEMKGRVMTMSYHEVPPDVLENAPELVAWACRAIEVAARSGKSPKRAFRKPSRS